MKTLYNTDHQPAVVSHDKPAVQPGESHNFTDEQVEAGIAGSWSEDNPRKPREDNRATKKTPAKPATTEPAQPEGDEKQ